MKEQQTSDALMVTDIMLEIFRLSGKLLDKGDGLVRPLRLTSADWQLLGAVALAEYPMTAPMIAEAMGRTRQGTQKRLNKMVKDGYFLRQANPRHERSPFYIMTKRGSAAFEAAMALHARWANNLALTFESRELSRTLKLLRALNERLDSVAIPTEASSGEHSKDPSHETAASGTWGEDDSAVAEVKAKAKELPDVRTS